MVNHLHKQWLTKTVMILWMMYLQLEKIMTNEYIYICIIYCEFLLLLIIYYIAICYN